MQDEATVREIMRLSARIKELEGALVEAKLLASVSSGKPIGGSFTLIWDVAERALAGEGDNTRRALENARIAGRVR